MRRIKSSIKLREIFELNLIDEKSFKEMPDSLNFLNKLIAFMTKNDLSDFNMLFSIFKDSYNLKYEEFIKRNSDIAFLKFSNNSDFYDKLIGFLQGYYYIQNKTGKLLKMISKITDKISGVLSDSLMYYVAIDDKIYLINLYERPIEYDNKLINTININFDKIDSFFTNFKMNRVEGFYSNQRNADILFSYIFFFAKKINNSENTVFSFITKLEESENKKLENLKRLENIYSILQCIFYPDTDILLSLISEYFDNGKTLPDNIYKEYLDDTLQIVLDLAENLNFENFNNFKTVFSEFIENMKNKNISAIKNNLTKLNNISKYIDVLHNFKTLSPNKYYEQISKNFLRNRIYRILLRRFGIVNIKYSNYFILFSKAWE
jgi:hypothetical protein